MVNISDNALFHTGTSYTAADMRTINRDDFQFPGVVRGSLNELAVSATTPGATMAVFVASGEAVIQDTRATGNSDFFRLTSRANPVTVTITNGDATNPRYDLIVIRTRNVELGDGSTVDTIEVVQGTPAGSPSVPATPQGSVALAKVLVTAGNATGIVAGNITDLRTYAVRAAAATTKVDTTADPGWKEGTIVFDVNDGKGRAKVNGVLTLLGGGGGLPTTQEFYAHSLPLSSATFASSTNTVTTAATHGLSVGDVVIFDGIHSVVGSTSSVLPFMPYYVKTVPSSTTFTFSTTSGGSTFAFGCDGSTAAVRKVTLVGGGGATMASNVFTTTSAHGLAIGDVVVFGTMTTTNLTPAKPFYVLTVPSSTTFTISAANPLLTNATTQSMTTGSTAAVVKIGGWFSWTAPTNVKTVFGTLVSGGGGAGGGSGGSASTNATKDGGVAGSGGSGAGAGGCVDFGPLPVVPGTTYSFYLGHGGFGGTGGLGGLTTSAAGAGGGTPFDGGMSQAFGSTLGGGGQGTAGVLSGSAAGGTDASAGAFEWAPGGGSGGSANGASVSTTANDATTGSSQGQAGPASGGNGGYLVTLAATAGSTGTATGGAAGTSPTSRIFTSVYKPGGGAGGQGGQGGYGGTQGAVSTTYYSGQGGQGGIGGKHNPNQPGAALGGGASPNTTVPTNSVGGANANSTNSAANLDGGAGGNGQPGQPASLAGQGGNGGGGGAGGGGGRNTSVFKRGGDGGAGSWGGPGYLALSYVLPS